VLASFSQGAVAAVVGAGLGAVTEPVVNKVLVERISLGEALAVFDWNKAWRHFYLATLPTNLIKFPVYEVINTILSTVALPETGRGAITGAVFTTLTLPLGNYRFYKSMNLPISPTTLYKAYLPTLLRDVLYGIVRSVLSVALHAKYPSLSKTASGRFISMFAVALCACIASSPGNELRGYMLQPPDKRQGFTDFFQPSKYIRSTSVGATNLGLSLGTGTLAVEPVKKLVSQLRAYLAKKPEAAVIVGLWLLHQRFASYRQAELIKATKGSQE